MHRIGKGEEKVKGIINKGIQDMVEARFGPETWEEIKGRAGCNEPFFAISLDYPDEMSLALAGAAAEVAGLPLDTVLIEYGRFLIPNTLKREHPTYFALAGSSPREFLLNMNRVHEITTRNIPDARPPIFGYEELPDGRLLMHYDSSRRLCRVLHGLILGVGDLFGEALQVREIACMQRGDPRCTMEVTFP